MKEKEVYYNDKSNKQSLAVVQIGVDHLEDKDKETEAIYFDLAGEKEIYIPYSQIDKFITAEPKYELVKRKEQG